MGAVRVVEVLAAVSLTTDLAGGTPFEKGLRTCAVATEFGRRLGLHGTELATVHHTALLRAVGCTSHASENAAQFDDDIAFQHALKDLDPGDPDVFGAQLARFGDWAGERQGELVAQFAQIAPTVGPQAVAAACEVGFALAPALRLAPGAARALEDVYERWDGLGNPGRRSGTDVDLATRIVHVAERAVLGLAHGSLADALADVRRRRGGQLDPDLVDRFLAAVPEVLAPLDRADPIAEVVACEPGGAVMVDAAGLVAMARALAMIVDLKGRYLLGHSQHVAALAVGAAARLGVGADRLRDLELAAYLHDLGRAAVPSSVWDRPGPHSLADEERARLHGYWTGRVLHRVPALRSLAELAASHHERLDGSGYHRGIGAADLDTGARLLAAADAYAELTEPRAERPALDPDDAAARLTQEAGRGTLDAQACAAVVAAASGTSTRATYPAGLSEREVDVLRLLVRGLSNREIADELVLSPRTVGNHLARVYDKTGRRTRAGAAVFAMEHGLLRVD